MSEQIPSPRSNPAGENIPGRSGDIRADLWPPVLFRAVVALIFAAVTIFWQQPDLQAAKWVMGMFLVGTGLSALYLQVRLNARDDVDLGPSRSIPQTYGILYILGGVLVAILSSSDMLLVLFSAAVLGLAGLMELMLGMRFRTEFPLGRDWTLCGLITVVAGAGMVFVESMGTKAELGVAGGAAILIGVTQLIAALSLRHDSRQANRVD